MAVILRPGCLPVLAAFLLGGLASPRGAKAARPNVVVGGGKTLSVFLNDTPMPVPAIRSLSLEPGTLVGGCQSSTGTVILTAPAPVGGAVVSLATNNPGVTLPARVTVPEGAVSASFSPVITPLSWIDNSDNETGFQIWRKAGGRDWAQEGAVALSTTFTDTGLTAGTTYTYRVRAVNQVGPSDWSSEVTVMTPGGP